MAETRNTLQMEVVTVDSLPGYDIGLTDVSLSLDRGQLALVMLERPNFRTPLADIAGGVLEPENGAAKFLGRDWHRYLPTKAARLRGLIGRVFEGQNWVSNLNMDENVLLQQRHHGRTSEADLLSQAEALARSFGLSGLPTARPAATTPQDLKRCACVRAFLGEPCLVILERPTHAMPDLAGPLRDAVATARRRNAAVLWLTNLPEEWEDPALEPTVRYEMRGARLQLPQAKPANDQAAKESR